MRKNGKKVVAATFPGADATDITIPGLKPSPIIQTAANRTVDYTIPFGANLGVRARGFSLTAADFTPAPSQTIAQLKAAGRTSYSQVQQTTNSLEKFTVGGVDYDIQIAALDTTNDRVINYDTLVFFDANKGIQSGKLKLPATGSAFVKFKEKKSSLFYLEGSENKAGTAFYISQLDPKLKSIRLARYSVNAIPRNNSVLADVDDINNNVGFWAPQPDFRIAQRISPGFEKFSDIELEEIYEDQVETFVDYQTRMALRAINKNPNADLVMLYIQEPDGSEHQFFITDPRQATNTQDWKTIGTGQDKAKIARYQKYIQNAYRTADNAVQRIIEAVGITNGKPNSNIIVVSDHGFSPFHSCVDINAYLKNSGFDTNKVRAVTSGPAANIYINLQGRQPNGTVIPEEYK